MPLFLKRTVKRALGAAIVVVGVVTALQMGGCYYMQAVNGQLEVLRKREPIAELLEDPTLPEVTRQRLATVLDARRFAVETLLLPENDSYRTYTDLERDYVVWNVFAAPEFSLEPKTWCFPVVGCVAYRGYFSQASAERQAQKLSRRGYDVYVGGVPAYSTLGRFDDPVLNTMLRWSDLDLVSTLFHELAHQRLFIKGDTGFNESFATAVAEFGLERWLTAKGRGAELDGYRARDELRRQLMTSADATKTELEALYALDIDDGLKRARKQRLIDALVARAAEDAKRLGFQGSGWLRPPLNNARLASLALYRGQLGAFRRILADCGGDLACFYAEAERLGNLPPADRRQQLDRLGQSMAADGLERSAASAGRLQGLISGR